MGTRSNIGLINTDGTIETIYTHWDGYPEWVGVILAMNYKNDEQVKTLLSFGDRSSLYGTPTAEGSYGEKGEDCPSEKWASFAEYDKAPKKGAEFVYLFQGGTWYIYEVADDYTLAYIGVISNIKVDLDTSEKLELPTGV